MFVFSSEVRNLWYVTSNVRAIINHMFALCSFKDLNLLCSSELTLTPSFKWTYLRVNQRKMNCYRSSWSTDADWDIKFTFYINVPVFVSRLHHLQLVSDVQPAETCSVTYNEVEAVICSVDIPVSKKNKKTMGCYNL